MRLRAFFVGALVLVALGCSPGKDFLHDGYYSAQSSEFNRDGWQAFVTLFVHNNRIITAEFNAKNRSGLMMSWDVLYLGRLKAVLGVHPNQIVREYTNELLNRQDPGQVRRVAADTLFYDTFTELSTAALAQARAGDKAVAVIPAAGIVPGIKP